MPNRHAILDVFDRIFIRAPFVRPRAVELFCGAGDGQAKEYANFCDYLEGWDNSESQLVGFKRNIPQAVTRLVDVYEEAARFDGAKFNVVLVDNAFLKAPKFEHFDLFPSIFRLMANPCFVVLVVCPDPFTYAEPRKARLLEVFCDKVEDFFVDWDAARDRFYGLPPLDPANMPKIRPVSSIKLESLEEIYKQKFLDAGFIVPYSFSCKRGRAAGYVLIEAHQVVPSIGGIAGEALDYSDGKKKTLLQKAKTTLKPSKK